MVLLTDAGAPAVTKPLASFVLVAYNQAPYIREAVAAAFAQTYTPLEIVLCDDHSSDGTARIIREMAEAYQGPHRLVFDLSEHNVGNTVRINRGIGIAAGSFIVLAAGDDISRADRVAVLVDAWQAAGCRNVSIFSAYDEIDSEGRFVATRVDDFAEEPNLHRLMNTRMYSLVGATHAFAKPVYERFGPILTRNAYEDRVIAFRAALLDGVHYVREPLVSYRRHENAASMGRLSGDKLCYKLKELEVASSIYLNYMKDLQLHAARDPQAVTYDLQQTACDLYLKNRRRLSLLKMASRRTRVAFVLRHWLKIRFLLADLFISLAPGKYLG